MTHQEIEKNTVGFLRTAGGTRPDVRIVEMDNRRMVVKDFRKSDFLFRVIVGPILIGRERKAMERLLGVSGVPQLIESLDRRAFVMEHIESKTLKQFEGQLDKEFFEKLSNVVQNMHQRGVTHCDMRSSGNVLVAADGSPYVIDFGACVLRGKGLNPFINFLFKQFVQADNYAILVLKRKHAPELLTEEEKQQLSTPMAYERIAVGIGKGIRNITRKLLTKKNK